MRPVAIGGATKVVGLIGGPEQVTRSLSPAIHNAAFEALGLDWAYLAFGVRGRDVHGAVRGLASAGVRGLNVTMPHKVAAASAVDRLDGDARLVGAVNTVEIRGAELIGHNTDGRGLVRFLEQDLGVSIAGSSALVIGSGGAARSAVAALAVAGAERVAVLARDIRRGAELELLAGNAAFEIETPARSDHLVAASTIIVNATPVGQLDEAPLIDTRKIRQGAVVVDLVYDPPVTTLVEEARRRGASAAGGIGMLLHQAGLAFEIWTGVQPPLEAMSAAALASLKGRTRGAD